MYEAELSEQLEQLLKELKIPDDAKILELAAGTGFISAELANKGYKTTVTSFDEDFVRKAKEYYEKRGLKGNFLAMDILGKSENIGMYDVVFIIETLDHYDAGKVIQALEKMKELGQIVIVLSQNPKCMPCLMYDKVAKERGDSHELIIFRNTLGDLAKIAGLEVVKETFFSATHLSKWMAGMISPETAETYADSIQHNLIPEDQQHFKVLIAKRRIGEIEANERISLYETVLKSEIEAFRRSYDLDTQALNERISNLEDELVTRINSIRQLELVQQYGNTMIKTPMGLLLSLYYQRADLQEAFPEVVNHNYRRLLQWAKETVDGSANDYSTNKLREFREWYIKAGNTWFANEIDLAANNPIGLLLSIYYQRPDLQQAFPEVKDRDYARLIQWAATDGISHDSNADKLLRFAEWYKSAKPLDEIVSNEKSNPLSVLLALYLMRKDLHEAFPEVVNHDYKRLLKWAQETVDGSANDYSTNKLREFREWYIKAGNTWFANEIDLAANNPIGLLLSLYYQRPDLQQAFPEVKDRDYARLIQWAATDGVSHDSNADKLSRFAEWYKSAKPLNEIVNNEKSNPLSVLLALYLMRKDLHEAFPEVVNHDYKRLLKWAQETVDGKTGDSNADKLLRFAEWYRKAGDNPASAKGNIPPFRTITAYCELFRNLNIANRAVDPNL